MYYYVPSREVESSRVSTPDVVRGMVGGGIDRWQTSMYNAQTRNNSNNKKEKTKRVVIVTVDSK
jgi:hypothetical protein